MQNKLCKKYPSKSIKNLDISKNELNITQQSCLAKVTTKKRIAINRCIAEMSLTWVVVNFSMFSVIY